MALRCAISLSENSNCGITSSWHRHGALRAGLIATLASESDSHRGCTLQEDLRLVMNRATIRLRRLGIAAGDA